VRTTLDTRILNQRYLVIELSDALVQNAEDLLEKYPLRAYDSVQLASALEANARSLRSLSRWSSSRRISACSTSPSLKDSRPTTPTRAPDRLRP
jgi:hypothetical protein